MNRFLNSMSRCPINQMVVFFEQHSHPFVGWLDENNNLCFEEDQFEAENYDGRASVCLNVRRRDVVGWMALPEEPQNSDWQSLVQE